MKVSILIPWRSTGPEREKAWAWLSRRWEALYADWELVTADSPDEWNRGIVANLLVARSSGDVLVMADADVWIPGLRVAVDEALHRPWVVPHNQVRRLTQRASEATYVQPPTHDLWPPEDLVMPPYRAWPGGGSFVMRRELWPGADETFGHGGGWDEGMAFVLHALVGYHHQLRAPLFHFFHPPARRAHHAPQQHALNVARIAAYRRLVKKPEAVRALLAGASTQEVTEEYLGRVRARSHSG